MLYLVATPIGNLADISLRALETLRDVDVIASEDTRKTGKFLKHFEIATPQLSFQEHNEDRAGERIMSLLNAGKSVAIVTDAGTPGIADPGYTIVRRAIAADMSFTMVPGPTGLIMAVVLSGLAVHSFTFRGFPPRKPGPRKRFFAIDRDAPHTLLFYESPHRLAATMRDAEEVYGDRNAALANDLTKRFEQVQRGRLSELRQAITGKTLKGEFILVIAGRDHDEEEAGDEELETGSRTRIEKPNRETESRNRIEKPNRETESRNRIEKPNRETESNEERGSH